MSLYEAIKTKALKNVLKPNTDYYIRRIYRWYSKTYHTPLEQVFDIPIEEVLNHFYEERFEAMEEEERAEVLEELTETDEARKERLIQEDYEKNAEHQLMEMARKSNKKVNDKARKVAVASSPKATLDKLPEQISNLSNDIKSVAELLKEEMRSDPLELPPEIDMKFDDDKTFDALLNGPSIPGGEND